MAYFGAGYGVVDIDWKYRSRIAVGGSRAHPRGAGLRMLSSVVALKRCGWDGVRGLKSGALMPVDIESQAETLRHPGLTIARTAGSSNLTLALAAAWIFAPESDVAVAATEHDSYSDLPALDAVDLGTPVSPIQRGELAYWREFTRGRAAINLGPEPVVVWGQRLEFLDVILEPYF